MAGNKGGTHRGLWAGALVLAGVLAPAAAYAAGRGDPISAGDTAWVLASAALVLFMTPGLALFYGGMVRSKNVISVLLQVFAVMALVSVQWVLVGYSLAFGPDVGHVVGSLAWAGLQHVGFGPEKAYAPTVPHLAFAIFQMMFAIITPALIVGGFAERMRFSTFLVFILLWSTFVYDPLAHWVWGQGGWLKSLGVLDFAGGTVVHISSGVAGLVAALVMGHRHGYKREPMRAHNLPMVVLGASLLWFGWFGFNAGSALAANGLAAEAFLNTNTAAAAASLGWMAVEWWRRGKPSLLGAAAGAVAGLVAITPAAGFVTPLAAVAIGAGGGVACYFAAVVLKERLGYDDALDAFGGHGVGGTWGALATGVFATLAANPQGANGLLAGNPRQVLLQLVAVLATWAFSGGATYVILKVLDALMGLRVPVVAEKEGLDRHLHGEEAYVGLVEVSELRRWVAQQLLGSRPEREVAERGR